MAMALTRWGTWEELVLGGAVLRHGTASWPAVAGEITIRARTNPANNNPFTPEECEAKYEDLQQRFAGSEAWFEELRRQRVEELKRELEISENSIGSLQSKLESLNAERGSSGGSEYNTKHTEIHEESGEGREADGAKFKSDEQKDASSAGSLSVERDGCNAKCVFANLGRKSSLQTELRKRSSGLFWTTHRKRRGSRKRKEFDTHKEENLALNDASASSANLDHVGITSSTKKGAMVVHHQPKGQVRLSKKLGASKQVKATKETKISMQKSKIHRQTGEQSRSLSKRRRIGQPDNIFKPERGGTPKKGGGKTHDNPTKGRKRNLKG